MSIDEPIPDEEPLYPPSNLPPDALFLPPPAPPPDIKENLLYINIGDYQYEGYLLSNWSARITRLNQLAVTVLRVFYRFLGALNFNVNFIVNLPNPFSRDRADEPTTIGYEGFFALQELLTRLHTKVDNMHNDLEYIVPVASVVEHWQLKKEALRPQCIFLFGEWEEGSEKIGPPKWQTAVPYFDFSGAPSFGNDFGYWKGERQGVLTLADNSKVIIYARDDDEIDRMFTRYLEGIRADMKDEHYIKKGEYHGPPFHTRYVRLRRIDYYSTGQLRGPMDDYRWYSARPNELPSLVE